MLEEAVWRWRDKLFVRATIYVAAAAAAVPVTGWPVIIAWLSAFGLLQASIGLLFRRNSSWLAIPGRTVTAGVFAVLAQNAMAAVLALLVALAPSNVGLAIGYGIGSMSIVSVVVASGGRGPLFLAGLAPIGIVMLLVIPIALLAEATPVSHVISLAAASVTAIATAATLWRWHATVLAAEATARGRAEAATEAKSRLVATISHELRTPISAIQAGAQALGPQQVQAGLILQASRMMRTLLDDLLDHSKLEAGRLNVERVDFALRRSVAETVRFWRAEARQKGVRLALRTTGLPQAVVGDETRLRQILNNLLSNALKFSAGGAVSIDAGYADGTLKITVADMGVGMSEDQLARLFQPFSQADSSVARVYGGTGLGLSISRELALAMGGDLTVVSEAGRGSAFTLAIPAPIGLVQSAVEEPPVEDDRSLADLRVLVADDHQVNRKVIELFLAPLGVRLTLVEDGHAALEALAVESFDVLLLDVCMPGLDGYETARRLRQTEGPNRQTPIIAVTGALSDADETRRLAAGMEYVVAKPVDPRTLLTVVATAAQQGQTRAAVQTSLAVATG